MERAYTVAEIDALRQAAETKWLFGTVCPGNANSRVYYENEKTQAVEAMVRTYMQAGITASDLWAAEQRPAQ